MPIYEFECKNCDKTFEELVLNRNEEINCKHCGSKKVHRILSSCGIVSSSKTRGELSSSYSSSSSCSACSTHNCATCK